MKLSRLVEEDGRSEDGRAVSVALALAERLLARFGRVLSDETPQ